MEQRVLTRLGRLNPTSVFLATAALMFLALFLPGVVGAVLLLMLAAGLTWLLRRTWHVHTNRTRTARIVILALLVALAVGKLTE
jgi:hypothetical protein